MESVRCISCGVLNRGVAFCTGCGNSLDPDDILTMAGNGHDTQEGQPASVESSGVAPFGFDEAGDLEFIKQGIGAGAAKHLKDRFRPITPISEGGMGKLFLVQEVLSGRFVALKAMLDRASDDVSLVQQFVREAVITARLQHPHIIPVHELGFLTAGQLYYTMRYVDGYTFDEIMPSVELEERLRILRSAATAVTHAHGQGLWHRDLKPHNILVGSLGDTYVIDWGLVSVQPGMDYRLNLPRIAVEKAIYVMPDNLIDETRDAVTTRSGGLIGTPAYMSPEQFTAEDSSMGCVSDVWAFGVMLFEALTGQHPIKDVFSLGPAGIFRYIVHDNLPSPSDLSKDVPTSLDQLCRRMLVRDPTERMATLGEFIDKVTEYLKDRGRTIAGFGTFTRTPQTETDGGNESLVGSPGGRWRRELTELRNANSALRLENERYKEKAEILAEIVQLGMFSGRRKRQLWGKLARL